MKRRLDSVIGSTTEDNLKIEVESILRDVFHVDTIEYEQYRRILLPRVGHFQIAGYGPSPAQKNQDFEKRKQKALDVFERIIKRFQEELEFEDSQGVAEPLIGAVAPEQTNKSGRVFVVHGRDEGPREAVARFLERIGLEPIILHEQPNRGLTVIEKVEAFGDVGFAVVLLTPDDEGGISGQPHQPRPRQNVLLELGYFIGRLKRDRVCALKVGEMELPSDFAGVLWERFDGPAGGWKEKLGKELKAAGFEIDWNKVMV